MTDLGHDVEALMIDARHMVSWHGFLDTSRPRPEQVGGYQITSDGYRWVRAA